MDQRRGDGFLECHLMFKDIRMRLHFVPFEGPIALDCHESGSYHIAKF